MITKVLSLLWSLLMLPIKLLLLPFKILSLILSIIVYTVGFLFIALLVFVFLL